MKNILVIFNGKCIPSLSCPLVAATQHIHLQPSKKLCMEQKLTQPSVASADTSEAGIQNTVPDHGCPSFSPHSTPPSDKVKKAVLWEVTNSSTVEGPKFE